jgi:hypothetical protein
VPDFKLYCYSSDGHITKRHEFTGDSDAEALEKARELCGEYDVEVWQHIRFVGCILKNGSFTDKPLPPPPPPAS